MSASFFTASAVLFDLNGVLADSIPTLNNVYMEFLNQFGFEGSPEEFDTHLNGRSDKEIVNYLNWMPILNKIFCQMTTYEAGSTRY